MKGEEKDLIRSSDTDMYHRIRPQMHYKNTGYEQFTFTLPTQDPNDMSQELYALVWCREIKYDKTGSVFPSINEMLDGLLFWICNQERTKLHAVKDTCAQDQHDTDMSQASYKGYKEVMDGVKNMFQFTKSGTSLNLRGQDENSLDDPYSKATNLIIYLFSLEFGSPPLYSEVNRVCRHKDKS